jgi:hypothetical protein
VKVHSLTLSFTPGLPSWPATLQALALVANPRLGLQHFGIIVAGLKEDEHNLMGTKTKKRRTKIEIFGV